MKHAVKHILFVGNLTKPTKGRSAMEGIA